MTPASTMVSGTCDGRFERVHEEFERNFAERDELGASVCATIDGETVVDLWGGYVDEEKSAPWTADTISVIWSVSKTVSATCAHMLASRGEIDLDASLAEYWPEYGTSPAKCSTTVADSISHLAAQPGIQGDVPPGALYDWDWMTETLAAEEPFWDPGTMACYHGLTFGFHAGEVIRRVTGQTLGGFLRSEIAIPLGLDMWLGLPDELESRVAPMVLDLAMLMPADSDVVFDAGSLPQQVMGKMMEHYGPEGFNSPRAHAAELPAVGVLTNARSLAGLYRPLALDGSFDGVRLVTPQILALLSNTVTGSTRDPFLGFGVRYAMGYWRSMDNRRAHGDLNSFIVGRNAFGHVGFGGIGALADPDERMSMAYTMNRMGPGAGLNPRGQRLIDAAYRCLGYTTDEPGFWVD